MLVFRVHTKWMLPDAEFRLIAGSIPAYGVSEICNSEICITPHHKYSLTLFHRLILTHKWEMEIGD